LLDEPVLLSVPLDERLDFERPNVPAVLSVADPVELELSLPIIAPEPEDPEDEDPDPYWSEELLPLDPVDEESLGLLLLLLFTALSDEPVAEEPVDDEPVELAFEPLLSALFIFLPIAPACAAAKIRAKANVPFTVF
jgi:hypothetical protein